jgi:hypothetical protein
MLVDARNGAARTKIMTQVNEAELVGKLCTLLDDACNCLDQLARLECARGNPIAVHEHIKLLQHFAATRRKLDRCHFS